MAKSTYKRIAAVEKTLEILDYLAHRKEPATGVDIANATNLNSNTVMCHLATLEDHGFVQQVGGDYDGAYRLGMKLAIYWARVKSNLEAGIAKQQQDLDSISPKGD